MVVCIYDVVGPLLGISPAELFNDRYLYTSSVTFSPFDERDMRFAEATVVTF